jgi:hypothetical protein
MSKPIERKGLTPTKDMSESSDSSDLEHTRPTPFFPDSPFTERPRAVFGIIRTSCPIHTPQPIRQEETKASYKRDLAHNDMMRTRLEIERRDSSDSECEDDKPTEVLSTFGIQNQKKLAEMEGDDYSEIAGLMKCPECGIGFDDAYCLNTLSCGHSLCGNCITRARQNGLLSKCSVCSTPISTSAIFKHNIHLKRIIKSYKKLRLVGRIFCEEHKEMKKRYRALKKKILVARITLSDL